MEQMNITRDDSQDVKSSLVEAGSPTFMSGAKIMIKDGPLNILLVCIPIGMISFYAQWPDAVTFIFSLLAIAPLAERLGFVTEQLALHTNETVGGLLNATFGNATELIVAITALSKKLYRLVQLSLLGSILSNMLLVLGCAFLFGGWKYKTQRYSKISAQINSTLLVLSTMGLLFPTVLTMSGQESNLGELGLSRFVSFVLLFMYLAFLYFQLVSHSDLYENESKEEETDDVEQPSLVDAGASSSSDTGKDRRKSPPVLDKSLLSPEERKSAEGRSDNDDEDEEEDVIGYHYAILWLAIITLFIAILSDALSDSIQDAASSVGISGVFLSAIVLPIVGNAAEHAGAVMFAMKNKLDLSLGVAIGSSTQIALLVIPLLVILGWMGDWSLSLNFGAYESFTLFLSVVAVTFAIKDGTSNWFLGLALCSAYLVVAAGFWAHHDDDLKG